MVVAVPVAGPVAGAVPPSLSDPLNRLTTAPETPPVALSLVLAVVAVEKAVPSESLDRDPSASISRTISLSLLDSPTEPYPVVFAVAEPTAVVPVPVAVVPAAPPPPQSASPTGALWTLLR